MNEFYRQSIFVIIIIIVCVIAADAASMLCDRMVSYPSFIMFKSSGWRFGSRF